MSKRSKVEELRAKLAEARAPREQKQAELEDAAEIARLEQEIADEPHIAKAVEEHGAIGEMIAVMHTQSGAVIVKRPQQAAWRRFSDSDTLKGKDVHRLAYDCLVYPSRADFDRICDAHPAALEQVGVLITDLASVRARDLAGK